MTLKRVVLIGIVLIYIRDGKLVEISSSFKYILFSIKPKGKKRPKKNQSLKNLTAFSI